MGSGIIQIVSAWTFVAYAGMAVPFIRMLGMICIGMAALAILYFFYAQLYFDHTKI